MNDTGAHEPMVAGAEGAGLSVLTAVIAGVLLWVLTRS